MEMKKVSIIIPIYKSEQFIDKLMYSLINQTYDNLEIILVDDESPDCCGKICDNYAEKDKRIRVIHQKNQGTCKARNVGLSLASGEYIMFVDGDDWLELDCVEYLMNLIIKYNCEMAITDSIFTTRNRKQNEKDSITLWDKEKAICGILYVKTPIGPWNKLYSLKVIKENNINFSVPWFGEGLYFSVMAAQASNQVAVGHKKIYNYRMNNPNSGTTIRDVKNGLNSLKNIYTIKEELQCVTNKTMSSVNWHIFINNFNLLIYIVGSKTELEYKEELNEAIRYIKKHGIGVLLKSNVSMKHKIYIFLIYLFPIHLAKFMDKRKRKKFQADNKF